ncbi:unnamed protein product [Lymnaea stagnalis]|uniref:Uncharacterized protein n=1 Tax=Lymnaea stagnalis TaxID=6523 RepID=A0AAV2IRX3_LYMST
MLWALVVRLLLAVLGLTSVSRGSSPQPVPDEQRLYDQIMGSYLKTVRPVVNSSLPLQVMFSIRLNQIVNLNERQQVLTTNVFIDQSWTDPALSWNPKEYRDVRSLRIPAEQVWKPDTFIYNNADNGSTGFIHGTYIQIRHTGEVKWPVPMRLRSSCVVKITYFPFDYQFCMVRFGSWIYSHKLVDYKVRHDVVSVDLSTYIKNSEWDLLSMKLEKSVANRSRGLGAHPHITAVLYLKRNTFYYLFNIIVPCVMLSLLTLMTFWLSPTSGEKVTLGLSVFLAFSMFMLLIAEEVPASSDAVPLIGIYLCVVMTMTSLSVICAVLVTNLHNRGSKLKPAPRWVASLFIRYLALPFRVSQDVQLLASTIFLSDYCKYFILHDSRTTNQNNNNATCKYSEPDSLSGSSATDNITKLNRVQEQSNSSKACSQRSLKNSLKHNGVNSTPHKYQEVHPVIKNNEVFPKPSSEVEEINDTYRLSTLLQKSSSPGPINTHLQVNSDEDTHLQVNSEEDGVSSQLFNNDQNEQETTLDDRFIYSSGGPALPVISENGLLDSEADFLSSHTPLLFEGDDCCNAHHNKDIRPCHSDETYCECGTDMEDVWVMREDFVPTAKDDTNNSCMCLNGVHEDIEPLQTLLGKPNQHKSFDSCSSNIAKARHRQRYNRHKRKIRSPNQENPKLVLKRARIMIAEWCTIAKVVDRCLFLLSFIATVFAYVFLLIIVPAGYDIKSDNVTFANSINTGQYRWN